MNSDWMQELLFIWRILDQIDKVISRFGHDTAIIFPFINYFAYQF